MAHRPDLSSAYLPEAAMDDNGNALIAWYQVDEIGDPRTYKSEYRRGAWIHPAGFDDFVSPLELDDYPRVAMGGDGSAVIVNEMWEGFDRLFVCEYRDGRWIHPANETNHVSPDGDTCRSPAVAMDAFGNAVVAWQQRNGANYQVYVSQYRNGLWTHPVGVSEHINPAGEGVNAPRVAMDDLGNAIVVWKQDDETGQTGVFMSEFR